MNSVDTPKLLIITGLPGTGKTTVARALAQRMQVKHFNTDMIRQEMELRGRYDQKTKEHVYSILLERTRKALRDGSSVVVDGTFYQAKLRAEFNHLAEAQGAMIHWIELWADPQLIRQRVSKKRAYSEADYEVYLKIKASYEPIQGPYLSLQSNNSNLVQVLDEIFSYLDETKE